MGWATANSGREEVVGGDRPWRLKAVTGAGLVVPGEISLPMSFLYILPNFLCQQLFVNVPSALAQSKFFWLMQSRL